MLTAITHKYTTKPTNNSANNNNYYYYYNNNQDKRNNNNNNKTNRNNDNNQKPGDKFTFVFSIIVCLATVSPLLFGIDLMTSE